MGFIQKIQNLEPKFPLKSRKTSIPQFKKSPKDLGKKMLKSIFEIGNLGEEKDKLTVISNLQKRRN